MDDDDCPFVYGDDEERPPTPEHEVIGQCVDCGGPGYIMLDELILCFPCGYNRAN